MARRVYVGKLHELEDGEATAVGVEDRRLAVVRIGDEVFAVEDRCTHRECSLSEGLVEERAVICPCHGSEFDLETGAALVLPAKVPVETFDTEIEGDDLYVCV